MFESLTSKEVEKDNGVERIMSGESKGSSREGCAEVIKDKGWDVLTSVERVLNREKREGVL